MSYIQFQQRCADCGQSWNAAFGIVGTTRIAEAPEKCPHCGSDEISKCADGWAQVSSRRCSVCGTWMFANGYEAHGNLHVCGGTPTHSPESVVSSGGPAMSPEESEMYQAFLKTRFKKVEPSGIATALERWEEFTATRRNHLDMAWGYWDRRAAIRIMDELARLLRESSPSEGGTNR